MRWAALAITLLLAPAQADDAPLEQQVRRMIAEAEAMPTLDQADKQLTDAAVLLATEGRKVDEITRDFLTADVERARGRLAALAWRSNPDAHPGQDDNARRLLGRAGATYRRLAAQCDARARVIEGQIGDQEPGKDPEWRRLIGSISRANYAGAWAGYHLALVSETPRQKTERLESAVQSFLEFTAGGYRKHPIVADCFLGHALCLHELGRHFDALQLLKAATPDNTPPATFKRMTWVRVQAAGALPSDLEVENAARAYFDSLPAGHKWDAGDLQIALGRAKALARLADAKINPQLHRSFAARLSQVAREISTHGEPWRSQVAELLGEQMEDTAFARLARARRAFAAGNHADALAHADKGIALANDETPVDLRADLDYVRFASLWNLRRWREAAAAAGQFIRERPADKRARDVAAKGLQAAVLSRESSDAMPAGEFLAHLDLFERHYPDLPGLDRAPWHRAAVWIDAANFDAAEKQLDRIPADSPQAPWAEYGRALIAWRRMGRAGQGDTAAAAAEGVVRLLASLQDKRSPQTQPLIDPASQLALAVGRSLLSRDKPAVELADRLAAGLESIESPPRQTMQRTAALRLLVNIHRDSAEVRPQSFDKLGGELARVLAGDAAARLWSRFGRLTAGIPDIPPPPAGKPLAALPPAQQKSAQVTGQLLMDALQVILADASASRDNPDPQHLAARMRLAEVQAVLGRFEDARRNYQWVLDRVDAEHSGAALRGLARLAERRGRLDEAIPIWQKLARGLEVGTGPWFEARYHLIVCYASADATRQRARDMLRLLLIRHPHIGPGDWQARFAALAAELNVAPSPPTTTPDR